MKHASPELSRGRWERLTVLHDTAAADGSHRLFNPAAPRGGAGTQNPAPSTQHPAPVAGGGANLQLPIANPQSRLIRWYRRSARDLPWRRTRDPYCIWLSEIMLQQTRVQAVIPYYEKFLERFPDIPALAAASEAQVLACWSGLGYYSRARNLRRAAQQIVEAGRFPRDFDAIGALPGVGPYTAAAIASLAFDLPHAVLDGNVMRVIARFTNDASEIKSGRTRERFRAIAQEWLDPQRPGEFNQAMMELGATVCLPREPLCRRCPLARDCRARAAGTAAQLPFKRCTTDVIEIAATVVIVERQGHILFWRRPADSSRMAGFWELPGPERLTGMRGGEVLGSFRHAITHHRYHVTVISASLVRKPRDLEWVPVRELPGLPLSTIARKALSIANCEIIYGRNL